MADALAHLGLKPPPTLSRPFVRSIVNVLDRLTREMRTTPGLQGLTINDQFFSVSQIQWELQQLLSPWEAELKAAGLSPDVNLDDLKTYAELGNLVELQRQLDFIQRTGLEAEVPTTPGEHLQEQVEAYRQKMAEAAASKPDPIQEFNRLQRQLIDVRNRLTPQLESLMASQLSQTVTSTQAGSYTHAHLADIQTALDKAFQHSYIRESDILRQAWFYLKQANTLGSHSLPAHVEALNPQTLASLEETLHAHPATQAILSQADGSTLLENARQAALAPQPLESINQLVQAAESFAREPNPTSARHLTQTIDGVRTDLTPNQVIIHLQTLRSRGATPDQMYQALNLLKKHATNSTTQRSLDGIIHTYQTTGQINQDNLTPLARQFTSPAAQDILNTLESEAAAGSLSPQSLNSLSGLAQTYSVPAYDQHLTQSLIKSGYSPFDARVATAKLSDGMVALTLSGHTITPENAPRAFAQFISLTLPDVSAQTIETLTTDPQLNHLFHAQLNETAATIFKDSPLPHNAAVRQELAALLTKLDYPLNPGPDSPDVITHSFRVATTPSNYYEAGFDNQSFQDTLSILSHNNRSLVVEAAGENLAQALTEKEHHHHQTRQHFTARLQILHHPQSVRQQIQSFFIKRITPRLPVGLQSRILNRFFDFPTDIKHPTNLSDLLKLSEKLTGKALPQEVQTLVRLKDFFSNPWGAVKNIFSGGFRSSLSNVGSLLKQGFSSIANGIRPMLSRAVTGIAKFARPALQALGKIALQAGTKLAAAVPQLATAAAATIEIWGPIVVVGTLIGLFVIQFYRQPMEARHNLGVGGDPESDYVSFICTPDDPGCPASFCEDCDWPVDPACASITQCPGGSFSHSSLNAIDFVVSSCSVEQMGVYSRFDGEVVTVVNIYNDGDNNKSYGYGNHIIIKFKDPDSDREFLLLYAHLSEEQLVNVGDQVQAGQIIAKADHTGYSTAPHLHYELRAVDGGPVPSIATIVPNSGCN